jgi:hypothetical protein
MGSRQTRTVVVAAESGDDWKAHYDAHHSTHEDEKKQLKLDAEDRMQSILTQVRVMRCAWAQLGCTACAQLRP